MTLERDRTLLEAEIQRLGASSMVVEDDSEAPEGLEIREQDRSWISTSLNISETLVNWRQLPANVGSHEAWRKRLFRT
jgi:predicted component of type VI protein secretion system